MYVGKATGDVAVGVEPFSGIGGLLGKFTLGKFNLPSVFKGSCSLRCAKNNLTSHD